MLTRGGQIIIETRDVTWEAPPPSLPPPLSSSLEAVAAGGEDAHCGDDEDSNREVWPLIGRGISHVRSPSREVENEGMTDNARPEELTEQSDLGFPLPHEVPSQRPSTLSNVSSPSRESASSSSSAPVGSSSSDDGGDDVADRDGPPRQS